MAGLASENVDYVLHTVERVAQKGIFSSKLEHFQLPLFVICRVNIAPCLRK